jgi:hypothetical protein
LIFERDRELLYGKEDRWLRDEVTLEVVERWLAEDSSGSHQRKKQKAQMRFHWCRPPRGEVRYKPLMLGLGG